MGKTLFQRTIFRGNAETGCEGFNAFLNQYVSKKNVINRICGPN